MGAYWFNMNDGHSFGELTVLHERFVRDRIGQKPYVNMETAGFFVGPGHVMVDVADPIEQSSSALQSSEEYIKRGCTLLLIQHLVTSIRHYRELYDSFLRKLEALLLDFMILPVIPAKIVKPEMVRFFARRGCPFLCVQVESPQDLEQVSWEWLVQAQAHKRMPMTLFVKDCKNTTYNYSELWSSVCEQYGIIKLTDLQDDEIVSTQNLKDSGIYPQKGSLKPGGQADYNLYRKDEYPTFDDREKFRYHNAVPNVTVIKGRVKQVNQTLIDRERGSHVQVKIHKHFV